MHIAQAHSIRLVVGASPGQRCAWPDYRRCLDKPHAGFAMLILVARRPNGDQVRLPLTWQTITRLIRFINECRESFAGQITENNFVFLCYRDQLEIRLGLRSITMSQNSAYQLAEVLREHVA